MGNSSRRKLKRLKTMCDFHVKMILFIVFVGWTEFVSSVQNQEASVELRSSRNQTHEPLLKDSRGLFSPRMDYNQWKPLGRGDPLQNDPTYDYVPPVLERVHYWIEPPIKKPESTPPPHEGKKSEILVLGVSSKKPSTGSTSAEGRKDPYESFLKFIDGPKFYHHHHNSFNRPNNGQRPSHPMSHTYHPQFFKNKFDDSSYKADEQRMPYTVLVPPPIPPPHMEMPLFNSQPLPKIQQTTQRPVYRPSTTTNAPRTSVSVHEANLIYHSSSTGENVQWHTGPNQYSSLAASSQYVTWRTPTENPPFQNSFQDTVTKGKPIVFVKNSTDQGFRPTERPKPINQPIAFPTETTGRIVFEHHSLHKPSTVHNYPEPTPTMISPTGLFADLLVGAETPLVLAPTGSPTLHMLHVGGTQPAVTHMTVGNQLMHKGQVSDDTIGNAYVNIGKPNAHIQKEITTNKSPTSVQMPSLPIAYQNNQINSVYTPAIINNGMPFSRRPGPITEDFTLQTMQTMQPPPVPTTTEKAEPFSKKPTGFLQSLLQKETTTPTTPYTLTTYITTSPASTTTTTTTPVASLTTDPLFKHYKQPNEPLRGPMYLIIQGHSKVKTYGASHKDIHRISMPESNEIPQTVDKFPVKHLHTKKDYNKKEDVNHRAKGSRMLKEHTEKSNIKETELIAKYEVDDGLMTTEKYHKGIVESEEIQFGDRLTKKSSNKRQKRQLEEFIPVMEDAVENIVYDYLKKQSEGSGVGAILASAITSDTADDYVEGIEAPLDVDDEDDDDEDEDNDDEEEERKKAL